MALYPEPLTLSMINSNLETLNEGATSGCAFVFESDDGSFTLSLALTILDSDAIAQSRYAELLSTSQQSGYPITEGNNGPWIYHLIEFNDLGLASTVFSIKDNIQIGINAPQSEFLIEPSSLIDIVKTIQTKIDNPDTIPRTISTNQDDISTNQNGGGCLIATATYDSELSPQVQQLRELRDNSLLNTESGTDFMVIFNDIYYSFSPIIADYERENPLFKETVKVAITPLISSLAILNHVDMDSEAEVLGYGISLIMLNLAMYVGIPIVAVVGIRKI